MWKIPTVLAVIALVLSLFGMVMLYSTSATEGQKVHNDPQFFVKRQAVWLFISLVAAGIAAKLDYHHWRKLAFPLFIAAGVLLLAVLIPGIGTRIGGSRRWLIVMGFSLQPSELGKFALIVVMSWWMARERRHHRRWIRGFLMPGILAGVLLGLIFAEPDFGTTLLAACVVFSIMVVGGTRLVYLLPAALAGGGLFVTAIMHNPNRMKRFLAFLNPDEYAQTYAYQLKAALDAFVMGGLTGVGLGKSVQKEHYLPEAHTDFILAIIGEELGLIRTALVVLLFMGVFICGLRISLRAPDTFGRLLAFGITMMITLQVAINMGVVTGCFPTKGLPLPFISYGGSSLVMSLVSIGVLINIAQHIGDDADEDVRVTKDRVHRM